MALDTQLATTLAEEAMGIIHRGRYDGPDGEHDIGDAVAQAIAATVEYAPTEPLGPFTARHTTRVTVTDESTLAATRRLCTTTDAVAALVFASAKNPGGGFLAGALAQEESLCRSSTLFACLERQPMYGYHAMRNDPLYSDRVIYAPSVPVFRDDAGALIAPYHVTFLAAPAPNARLALERDAGAGPAIERALRQRARRVLEVAAAHQREVIVLGAWGAGVFGNAPDVVADAFGEALEGPLRGVFREVVFAVLGDANRAAFEQRFTGSGGVTP